MEKQDIELILQCLKKSKDITLNFHKVASAV